MERDPALDLGDLAHHEAWLRSLVRSLVGDDAAGDVLQQTWLRAWRTRLDRGTVRPWLARVATRLALSHRRAEQRRRRHEALLPAPDPELSTDSTVERLAVQRAVSAAVSDLAEPYRTTLLLRYYHALSVDDVARRTATTAANVRQRTSRGLQMMRERLAGDLGADWRRAPAVLLFAGCDRAAASVAANSLLLILLMNKLRVAVVTLVAVGLLVAVVTLQSGAGSEPGGSPAVAAEVATQPLPAADVATVAAPAPAVDRSAAGVAAPPAVRTFDGEVLDVHGRPVADVGLELVAVDTGTVQQAVRADALGHFVVAEPVLGGTEWTLRATGAWMSLATTSPERWRDHGPVLAVVAPTRAQTVVVQDPSGSPLTDTVAVARCHGLVEFPRVLDDTVVRSQLQPHAAADGRHRWDRLPIARTAVTIRKLGYRSVTVVVDAATPAEVMVTLAPIREGERVVSGIVSDARGALVHGATVGLGELRATTDANGAYALVVEPGGPLRAESDLYAVAPGWYPTVRPAFGDQLLRAQPPSLAADLVLDRASVRITGVVVDHAGTPQPDVFVYPWRLPNLTDDATAEDLAAPADREPLSLSGNDVRAFAKTDADGAFTLAGLDRRPYRLRVYQRAAGWAWTTAEIVGGAAAVRISLPADLRGRVRGRVVTRDGQPAVGVQVGGYLAVHSNGGGVVSVGLRIAAVTDAGGWFEVEDVPCHGASLSFQGPSWVSAQVDLDGPPAQDLEVLLSRRCHVRVRFADPAWASGRIEFLDGAGDVVAIHEDRARTSMITASYQLHDGKSEVLSVSEAATVLVVSTRAHGDAAAREATFPLALQPGTVNELDH